MSDEAARLPKNSEEADTTVATTRKVCRSMTYLHEKTEYSGPCVVRINRRVHKEAHVVHDFWGHFRNKKYCTECLLPTCAN